MGGWLSGTWLCQSVGHVLPAGLEDMYYLSQGVSIEGTEFKRPSLLLKQGRPATEGELHVGSSHSYSH